MSKKENKKYLEQINDYKQQITILENKLKIYEDTIKDKEKELSDKLVHIIKLQNENSKLKEYIKKYKNKILTEKKINNNNKSNNNKNINNNENNQKQNSNESENLKKNMEKLYKDLQIKDDEINNLKKQLDIKIKENELYNKDNTLLLNKFTQNESNKYFINNNENENNKFEEMLLSYSNMIDNKIKIISLYIDTYFDFPLLDILNIPNLKEFSNNDEISNFINFNLLIDSIEKTQKNINEKFKNYETIINNLKNENSLLSNKFDEKIIEISELKKNIINLNSDNYDLSIQIEKLNNNLIIEKNNSLTNYNNNNYIEIQKIFDNYLENLYKIIKSELDKLLQFKNLTSYSKIIYDNNNYENNLNNIKFLFEDIFDKYITINNNIIEEYDKILDDFHKNNKVSYNEKLNELKIENLKIKEENKNYENILFSEMNEKKLLINQIESLQNTNDKLNAEITNNLYLRYNNHNKF